MGSLFTEEHENVKKMLASRFNFPNKYEIDFVEEKTVKIEDQSFYINKTELKIIENKFKFELYYYIIIYWGLIIVKILFILILINSLLDMIRNSNFFGKYDKCE